MTKRWIVLALAMALAASGVVAQETTSGSITGKVVDAQGAPVPGATVTVISTQGHEDLRDRRQRALLRALPHARPYSVQVELAGFTPVEQKEHPGSPRPAPRAEDLTLKVGGHRGGHRGGGRVARRRHQLDDHRRHPGRGRRSRKLPVGRQLHGHACTCCPASATSGAGAANPSIGGASGLENNYMIDGVNITDVGLRRHRLLQPAFGSLGTGVTSDFIKETQVKTGRLRGRVRPGHAAASSTSLPRAAATSSTAAVFGYFRPPGAGGRDGSS